MYIGRQLLVKRNNVTVAGMRSKTVAVNNTAVDITTDDDARWRKLLDASGESQIDISAEGLTKDETLIAAAAQGSSLIADIEVTLPSGGKLAGQGRLNSVQIAGSYNEAVTFTAEIHSTGAWTYTPPS